MRNLNSTLIRFMVITPLILSAIVVYAVSTGKTGATRKNGNGCTCHGASPTSGVTVQIIGPDTLEANEKASYQVSISGGPAVSAGTNIAASAGVLSAGTGLKAIGNELTHTGPKAFSGNKVIFTFDYTAPGDAGTATLYANGNSVNATGNTSGDQWNFAPDKEITVSAVNNVIDLAVSEFPAEFSLNQNYPNPFNPTTTIPFTLTQTGNVSLKVYNMLGELVAILVEGFKNAGSYQISFDAGQLSSGTYLYQLIAENKILTRKMLVFK